MTDTGNRGRRAECRRCTVGRPNGRAAAENDARIRSGIGPNQTWSPKERSLNPTRPQILIGSIDADYYLLVIRILESEGHQVILRSGGRGDRPSRRRERCQSHPLSIGRRVGLRVRPIFGRQAVFITAPSMTTPAVTNFHSAIRSLRARATIAAFFKRPPVDWTRSTNQRLSADAG